jgi:DNA-binding PadR family transcriptional regulator
VEPLVTARLAVLHLLRRGDAHGRELIRRAQQVTGGEFRLTPARVYPALHDLASKGLVQGRQVCPGGARGARARTVYALTAAGRSEAAGQRAVLAALLQGTPPAPDRQERARMVERLRLADELSRAGGELRAAMARKR